MFAQHVWEFIDLFSLIAAAFAIWKGSAAERLGAAVVILNTLINEASLRLVPHSDALIRLGNDGVAAIALLIVTVRYGALWMGGVMLFFAAQFSLHSFYLVTDRKQDYLHALINNINWSGISWCLIIGTAVAWRYRVRAAAQPVLPAAA